MNELWLCREQTARVPFKLTLPDMEIKTIEELCYYLYHSMEYLDESVMEEPLFDWLSKELRLPRLAESLAQLRKQGRSAFWCAWFLLKEAGMYTEEELKAFGQLCQSMERRDTFERQKIKVDRLLANGKYAACIREYRQLLELPKAREKAPELLGDIRHNLGVAYARLFLFVEAAGHFQAAYGLNRRSQSLNAFKEAELLAREELEPGIFFTQAKKEAVIKSSREQELFELKNDYRKKVI